VFGYCFVLAVAQNHYIAEIFYSVTHKTMTRSTHGMWLFCRWNFGCRGTNVSYEVSALCNTAWTLTLKWTLTVVYLVC